MVFLVEIIRLWGSVFYEQLQTNNGCDRLDLSVIAIIFNYVLMETLGHTAIRLFAFKEGDFNGLIKKVIYLRNVELTKTTENIMKVRRSSYFINFNNFTIITRDGRLTKVPKSSRRSMSDVLLSCRFHTCNSYYP